MGKDADVIIKKFLKKAHLKEAFQLSGYLRYYNRYSVKDGLFLILLQEHTTEEIAWQLLLGIMEKYHCRRGFLSCNDELFLKIKGKFEKKYNCFLYQVKSKKQLDKLLTKSEIIVSLNTLPDYYIKCDGQLYYRIEITGYNKPDFKNIDDRNRINDYLKSDYLCYLDEDKVQKSPFSGTGLEKVYRGSIIKLGSIAEFTRASQKAHTDVRQQKENVLFYGSALEKNGITTSLVSLLNSIDLTKRNYIVCVKPGNSKKSFDRLEVLPDGITICSMNAINNGPLELVSRMLKYKLQIHVKQIDYMLERLYNREYKRNFSHLKLDHVIHYTGYESDMIHIFNRFEKNKSIYVHNDMVEEIKLKNNQHEETLKMAYQSYHQVVVVTEDILKSTKALGGKYAHYFVCNNVHDYENVLNRAKETICFQKDTKSTMDLKSLNKLMSASNRKLITIGRYSPEKGHFMLIDAFEKYHRKYNDAILIIIGGYGSLYGKTIEYVKEKNLEDSVALIFSINNPMPILKRCNLFILSSFYEGLGLVILEADTLHVPVIATNISGPQGFMNHYGGKLVEPTSDGIYEGILDFEHGKIKELNVNYREYNLNCIEQFESIF